MDAIGTLHAKLDLPAYESRLRDVAGIWRQIEKHQAAARKDSKALAPYAKYLERCIKQLQSEPEFTIEQTEAACNSYIALNARLYAELDIAALEPRRRPSNWYAWSRKHLAKEYAEYEAAMTECERLQNRHTFDNLNAALEIVLRAYAGAMK